MPESVPVLGVPVGTTGSTSVTGATRGTVRWDDLDQRLGDRFTLETGIAVSA